ncbi:hypothetical protein ADT25_18745 [Xanthomonas oryzae]|uniref:Uncharacterized protein n=1 Tax=Xanthomonas oryzae TaxID=347 RepID=A0AAP1EWI8_9XANT|nr:hypothetical protein ADT25_18745 [Xanthomonas oryzae]
MRLMMAGIQRFGMHAAEGTVAELQAILGRPLRPHADVVREASAGVIACDAASAQTRAFAVRCALARLTQAPRCCAPVSIAPKIHSVTASTATRAQQRKIAAVQP